MVIGVVKANIPLAASTQPAWACQNWPYPGTGRVISIHNMIDFIKDAMKFNKQMKHRIWKGEIIYTIAVPTKNEDTSRSTQFGIF